MKVNTKLKLKYVSKHGKFLYNGEEHTKISRITEYFQCDTTAGMLSGELEVETFVPGAIAYTGGRVMRNKTKELFYNRRIRRIERAQKRLTLKRTAPKLLRKIPRHEWESIIASSILSASLTQCCSKGCVLCDFIGWRGTLSKNIHPNYMSTKEYAFEHNISYRTVQRKCDKGEIRCFRINNKRSLISD